MSRISEKMWKKALTSILEELEKHQYRKMLEALERIPKGLKTERSKEEMPKTIIEHYGINESISAVNEAIDEIPRRDSAVQDLLRPFVEKLRKKDETRNKGFKKKAVARDSESSDEERNAAADQPNSCTPDKERKNQSWRKNIHDLRTSGDLGQKALAGKVVQKSGLRTYETKEKVKRFFFYLAVADETACIKVMVYGEELYQKITEKESYLFTGVIMEEDLMKVTKKSRVSKTSTVEVPEELELEALMIIYRQSPVRSITEAKMFDKTLVSVEGTIQEIGSVAHISLKTKRRKKEKQDFRLKDDTGYIRISLWGNDIKQLSGKSEGDLVRVTNVRTNHYYDTVSLNSTDFTRIFQVHSAAVKNVRILIIGITKANKKETHLEAEFNSQVQAFVVASHLLAKAFGVRLEGDFEERLLRKMPLSADAEVQGSEIVKISAA